MTPIVHAENRATETIAPASIANTIEYLKRENSRESSSTPNCNIEQKIRGRVLGVQDAQEVPIAGVQVELQITGSLKMQAASLPDSVLINFRKLFLERLQPVDLYNNAMASIADEPVTQFADVAQLPNVPGYELLAAAAKSHSDASFRQLLGNNPAIFQPLLCYYHPTSMPAVYSVVTMTDAAGFFNFLNPQVDEEQLGYRFVVRRSISANLYISLYNPSPAGWYTYWGLCDSEAINLRTRHPLALL